MLTIFAVSAATVPSGVPTVRALRAVPTGSVVTKDDVEVASCEPGKARRLRYDPHLRVMRTTKPIVPGECLRGALLNVVTAVTPGERVRMITTIGSIRIERNVETLQSAEPGDRLFVRGQDGAPFSIAYEELVQ